MQLENYGVFESRREPGNFLVYGPNWVVGGFARREDGHSWLLSYLPERDEARAVEAAQREATLALLLEPERVQ